MIENNDHMEVQRDNDDSQTFIIKITFNVNLLLSSRDSETRSDGV